jgi:beta-galactosidase
MKPTNHSLSTFGRTSLLLAASVAVVVLQAEVVMAAVPPTSPRERISINDDWRFTKDDPAGIANDLAYPRGRGAVPTSGIAAYILPTGNDFIADPARRHVKPDGNFGGAITYVAPTFNDADWRQLDLPHDFGVDGAFISPGQAGSDGAMGRLPFFGVAWYRKHLSIPTADAGKQIFLDVDGSMSYTTVWCNGQIVGGWPYGYTSWRVDLTPYVKTGADNVLAIRLDNPSTSSRWYPGGGIYRNVWLTKTAPVHIAHWGTFLTTPEATASKAAVTLKVTVDNNAKADVNVSVATQIFALDANGQRTGAAVASIAAINTPVAAGKSRWEFGNRLWA